MISSLVIVTIFKTAGIDCYMPANGETTSVITNPSVPVDMSLNLLKREMALGGEVYLVVLVQPVFHPVSL